MASLKLQGVTKRFGSVVALDRVTLYVAEREFVSILGPSGCGKTTLLRMVAGFEAPDEGTIELDGKVVATKGMSLPPEERELGMVFQSYALWPHFSVFENVAYGLRVRGIKGEELRDRVQGALRLVGLSGYESRKPEQLSGGQRQRVSLARCLVVRPRLVLLDEPLANLDANLREEMQTELRRIQRESGATFLFVTHDQEEALSLSDRVVVMDGGRVQQEDTPEGLYQCPATPMVASFIGGGIVVPAMLLSRDSNGRGKVRLGGAVTEARLSDCAAGRADEWGKRSLSGGSHQSKGASGLGVALGGSDSNGKGEPCLLCVRTENGELVQPPREAGALLDQVPDSNQASGRGGEAFQTAVNVEETLTGKVRWISYRGNGYLLGIEGEGFEDPARGRGADGEDAAARAMERRVDADKAAGPSQGVDVGPDAPRLREFRAQVPYNPPAVGERVHFRVRDAWVIPAG